MHSNNKLFKTLILVLTFSGVIPFLLYPILIEFFGKEPTIYLAPFLSYNNIIISFMCGTLWANVKAAQNLPSRMKFSFILFSIAMVLISWLSFNLLEAAIQLKVYAVMFVVLLATDFILHKHDHLARWYYLSRFISTVIVVLVILFSLRYM